MLVHKESRKLILNLRNPTRVTEVIPSAKALPHGEHTLVAVPHEDDEVRVLRNLGFDPPTPVDTYYDYPCAYPSGPMKHQRETVSFLTVNPRAYCLNGMGSGKTLSGIWAFDWLRVTGRAQRMVVVAPLSTLTRTWADEVFTHFSHLSCAVLHGSMERRLKLLAIPHDIYVVNHDGVKSKELLDALCARDDIDVVLIDELAVARTAGTERFRAFNRLVHDRAYVWGFTGTPTPNAPTDAWAQCRLITPHTVPKFFGQFRDSVMRQFGPYKWLPKPNAIEQVYEVMRPAIRFSREECIDLPPTTYQTREVELTKEQKALYNDMLKTLKAEYGGGAVLAVNEAVKISKLMQIVCGVAYGNDGEVDIPCQPRLNVLDEIIEEAEGKVIVFVPFTRALLKVAEHLRQTTTVEVVYGEVSKNERDRIFGAFQKTAHPRVIVADARTMSHGLSLTAANTTVWYGPTPSTETYLQANERTPRPGQKLSTHIIHIESSPAERVVYDRLRHRKSMNGALLDMVKAGG
jgi:SNF2 family DNA or RNA helicase